MAIDHVNALPPGTRFEEYRLDAVLGAGGFGITYRAYDANLDKFVAIKEYLPVEFATRTEASTVVPHSNADAQDYHWGLTRFLDEARTLARFDHPHLNRVHRFFESNGTAYMVLEYVEGETLADRLSRERQLPEESLQRLLEEILSGLEVMHEAGYVHRDIKPGNLMLREQDGSAVVLDFGAARQAVGQRSKAITSILTPGYAPVEQYDGKVDRVGAWTDIYALGMVAYRCISGIGDSELPDAVSRMLAHTKGGTTLPPATEAGKGKYNVKLLEAIDWAMEVDEEARPQNVESWRQALAGGGWRQGSAKPVRKPASQKTRDTTTGRAGPNWSTVALTLVIVVLLGVSAWWGWQEYPELFGENPGDAPLVTERAAPAETKTASPDATGTGEAVADIEQTPFPEDTAQAAPVKASAESVDLDSVQPARELSETSLADEDKVTRLLATAKSNLEAGRLTSPEWNNAWDNYQRVLELAPAHPDAIKGMEQVIEIYMELFGTALKQEAIGEAADYLAQVRDLYPGYPALEEGQGRLIAARQARTDRIAEQERQRQEELQRRQIAQEIKALWESFEAAIKAEQLDEASGILTRIRDLNSEESGLVAGAQRLSALEQQRAEAIQTRWSAFEAAIQAKDLDEATGILAQVRDLNTDAPALMAGEQRLASLEQQLTEQAIQKLWESFETVLDKEDFNKAANLLKEIRGLDPGASGLEAGEQRLDDARHQAALVRDLVGEMIEIPGGTFRMGDSDGDGKSNERPVHSVTVAAFRIGKHEVTFSQWDACVAGGNCEAYQPNALSMYWVGDNMPVMYVSWDEVQGFLRWLNGRTGGGYRFADRGRVGVRSSCRLDYKVSLRR